MASSSRFTAEHVSRQFRASSSQLTFSYSIWFRFDLFFVFWFASAANQLSATGSGGVFECRNLNPPTHRAVALPYSRSTPGRLYFAAATSWRLGTYALNVFLPVFCVEGTESNADVATNPSAENTSRVLLERDAFFCFGGFSNPLFKSVSSFHHNTYDMICHHRWDCCSSSCLCITCPAVMHGPNRNAAPLKYRSMEKLLSNLFQSTVVGVILPLKKNTSSMIRSTRY